MKNSGDPRVRYTRKMFQESLIELMKTRPAGEIGIKQICAEAGVSRSTFYTYYTGVADLRAQIEEETMQYFEEAVEQFFYRPNMSGRDMTALFERFLHYIADSRNPVQVLLNEYGNIRFQEKLFERFIVKAQQIMRKNAGESAGGNTYEAYSVFVVHGAVGLVRHWLTTGRSIPIPELARMLMKLTAEPRG